MRSSIEDLKQTLSKIAGDAHDDDADDEELGIYGLRNGDDSSVSDRRNSHSFAHSKPVSISPLPNGTSSPYNNLETEQYKAEIKRLQESEGEIKALLVNYAAILKEKEDQISRLDQENGSLKQNLDATRDALNVSRNENMRASIDSANVLKGSGDLSPRRKYKSASEAKNRYPGNHLQNGGFSRQDGVGNGVVHGGQSDETKYLSSQIKDKELADLLEEKNRSLAAMQTTHELQVKKFQIEFEKERDKVSNIQLKLEEEQNLNESLREELRKLKIELQRTSIEMTKLHGELNEKTSEIRRLQTELSRKGDEDANDDVKNLKRVIATLNQENTSLKIAKNELETALEKTRTSSPDNVSPHGIANSSESFPGKEEMELSLKKLERELKETRRGRDKAVQELTRLKQHLLEKESEEAEKMDEDSKIIEELREKNEYQKAQIIHLDKALKQAIVSQEEVKMTNSNELQLSKQVIDDLNLKLTNCMSIIDAKNAELSNLQTALGQYLHEIEAKEHLEQQLTSAREESAKLSKLLKDAEKVTEASKQEKEEILANLSHTERMLAEWKTRVSKLEEDNAKLRRALEQSMTRLNRMSVDSDFLVDRRIVIKLLVTYFQRNHSKEVLDLMVRMLGFSDEDKQRIGVAQQGGKGVVRGVLGLPGRLVGGILGGSSADVAANAASDSQSFADMWVDFLLKETEEREKRGAVGDAGALEQSPNAAGISPPIIDQETSTAGTASGPSGSYFSHTQNYSVLPPQRSLPPFAHSDSEFSTVPLTSLDSTSRAARLFAKH